METNHLKRKKIFGTPQLLSPLWSIFWIGYLYPLPLLALVRKLST